MSIEERASWALAKGAELQFEATTKKSNTVFYRGYQIWPNFQEIEEDELDLPIGSASEWLVMQPEGVEDEDLLVGEFQFLSEALAAVDSDLRRRREVRKRKKAYSGHARDAVRPLKKKPAAD